MSQKNPTKAFTRIDRTEFRGRLNNVSEAFKFTMGMYVKDPTPNGSDNDDTALRRIDNRKLTKLSDVVANAVNSVIDLEEITPYIGKAKVILKTLILYPNGRRKELFDYDTNQSVFKNAKLHDLLSKRLQEYYNTDYKIEDTLPRCVDDLTVGSGSYIFLNITRPALDNIINGQALAFKEGLESYSNTQLIDAYNESVRKGVDSEFKLSHGNAGDTGVLGKPHLLARNSGLVGKKSLTNLGGMESLFDGGKSNGAEFEFPLIGSEFGITLTDNLSVMALRDSGERMDSMRKELEAHGGMESLSTVIQSRLHAKSIGDRTDKDKEKDKDKDDKGNKRGKPTERRVKDDKRNPAATTQIMNKAQQEALQNLFEDSRSYHTTPTLSVKRSGAYSVESFGVPLRYKRVPSTALIPAHIHGDPTRLVGGFLLIDENGEWLNQTKDSSYYYSTAAQMGKIENRAGQSSTDNLIQNLKRIQQGNDCEMDMTQFATLAKRELEDELKTAVASGSSGLAISVEVEESMLMLFLERAFQRQRTRVLYVPAEYFTYIALDYNRLGIGRSFAMKARNFIARLAALDVADAIAQMDNAQTRNEMAIMLEEGDTDPISTIAMARGSWFKSNPTVHNLIASGIVSIPDIVDAIKEQMLVVRVDKGNNKFYTAPNTSVQQIERTGFKRIDDDSRQYLLSQIANTLHLPKSWLDERESGNQFQIEALAEQESLKNQTIVWQEIIADGYTDVVRKHTWLCGPLKNQLVDIIIDNIGLAKKPDSKEPLPTKTEEETVALILTDFLNNVQLSLPEPTTMESITKIRDKIDGISDLVEKWIESSGSKRYAGTVLTRMGIDTTLMDAEMMYEQLKAIYTLKLMEKMGVPTPFDEVVGKGKEGGLFSLFSEVDTFNENITLMLESWMTSSFDRAESTDKRMFSLVERLEERKLKADEKKREAEAAANPVTEDGDTSGGGEGGEFNLNGGDGENTDGGGEGGDGFDLGNAGDGGPSFEGGASAVEGSGEGEGETPEAQAAEFSLDADDPLDAPPAEGENEGGTDNEFSLDGDTEEPSGEATTGEDDANAFSLTDDNAPPAEEPKGDTEFSLDAEEPTEDDNKPAESEEGGDNEFTLNPEEEIPTETPEEDKGTPEETPPPSENDFVLTPKDESGELPNTDELNDSEDDDKKKPDEDFKL